MKVSLNVVAPPKQPLTLSFVSFYENKYKTQNYLKKLKIFYSSNEAHCN